MFWFYGHKVCGVLAPHPGIEPASAALEGKTLTTRPPGKSPVEFFFFFDLLCSSFENLSHRTSLMQIIRFFFSARTSAPPFQGDEQDMSALENKD